MMKKSRLMMAAGVMALALMLLVPAPGYSQWPTKQLNIVVPFSPGGTTDRVARGLGPFLEKELGVPVVLVNRKGGGGIVGTKAHLKNDPADGSFIVYSIQPYLSGAVFKGAFKIEDLDYLGLNYFSPQGLWVNAKSDYKTAEDLFKAVKAQPGKITMSIIPNSWSRVGNSMLNDLLGAEIKGIPYQGGGKQRMAVIKNDVVCTITEVYGTLASAAEDMRCLAVFGEKRLAELPDSPTINEVMKKMGLAEMPSLSNSRFFMVKKGFKDKYPDRWAMLAKALGKAVQNPEYVDMMAKQKLKISWQGPEATQKAIAEAHQVLQPFAHFWSKKK